MTSSKSHSSIGKNISIDWYTEHVNAVVVNEMRQRVRRATTLLKDMVLVNISRPVGKTITDSGYVRKVRSKEGEFPRRDFGELIRTMMSGMDLAKPGNWEGYVGTPLDYGATLETKRDRSFLVKTLFEEAAAIKVILVAPMKV